MIEACHELRHIDRDFGEGVDIIHVGAESGIRHRNDAGVNRAKDETCRERGVNISKPVPEASQRSRHTPGVVPPLVKVTVKRKSFVVRPPWGPAEGNPPYV